MTEGNKKRSEKDTVELEQIKKRIVEAEAQLQQIKAHLRELQDTIKRQIEKD